MLQRQEEAIQSFGARLTGSSELPDEDAGKISLVDKGINFNTLKTLEAEKTVQLVIRTKLTVSAYVKQSKLG